MSIKRKILVPIFYRAHYGRLRSVLRAIQEHPSLELQTMCAVQAAYGSFFTNIKHSEPRSWLEALPWYVRARVKGIAGIFRSGQFGSDFVIKRMVKDGFTINSRIPLFFDGGVPATMAKSTGWGIIKIVDELRRLKPDMVFVNADRFEMMAVTIAAAYLNIPIAHNEAGDVSGTIDESVRHAITKFAHVHFTSTEQSRKRVIQMGENPETVFTVGSPAIDVLKEINVGESFKVGTVDTSKPYILSLTHPVTTESYDDNLKLIHSVLGAIEDLKMPAIIIGSNSDAHSGAVGKTAAEWYTRNNLPNTFFIKSIHPDGFYKLLRGASCLLGNSSSFIREGAYFGTPAVIVGSRQDKRDRGQNVLEVPADKEAVKKAVLASIAHGRYASNMMFGDGNSGKRIADILATVNPQIQKKFRTL